MTNILEAEVVHICDQVALQSRKASQDVQYKAQPWVLSGSRLCPVARRIPVHTLLARRRDHRVPQRARRRQTAGRADEVDTREGHERCQLLQRQTRTSLVCFSTVSRLVRAS